MDPRTNPFSPGAGTRPPELAGRETVVEDADICLHRILAGRSAQSQMLLGLRGTGKTVLLNAVDRLAEEAGYVTSFLEAPENGQLGAVLLPKMQQTLRRLSIKEAAKQATRVAQGALQNFASAFKFSYEGAELAAEAAPGIAETGDLQLDLTDLFVEIGKVARAADKGWALLIDEVQYLSRAELSALIVATHRIAQKELPIAVFCAGLPQISKMSVEAKSYSERLFQFPTVAALSERDAEQAIRKPIEDQGEQIEPAALTRILQLTGGYPYFLQMWGSMIWNVADQSPITLADVEQATEMVFDRLDQGFFNIRLEQLTPQEGRYVQAMAALGPGPYRTADIAAEMGKTQKEIDRQRGSIINKGMIYSPERGVVAFTVPKFDDFVRRKYSR